MTPTKHTAELLAENRYRWHGDYNDTDLPYVIQTVNGPLVALMHSDFTDNRVLRGSPRQFLDVYRDTFDFLRTTGKLEMINLTLHTHSEVDLRWLQCLLRPRTLKSSGETWFARHDEVANYLLDLGQ